MGFTSPEIRVSKGITITKYLNKNFVHVPDYGMIVHYHYIKSLEVLSMKIKTTNFKHVWFYVCTVEGIRSRTASQLGVMYFWIAMTSTKL